jgi:Na+/H+-dicarboxylate symporter
VATSPRVGSRTGTILSSTSSLIAPSARLPRATSSRFYFFSMVFAVALHFIGDAGKPMVWDIERVGQVFFRVIRIVMDAAPIGGSGPCGVRHRQVQDRLP